VLALTADPMQDIARARQGDTDRTRLLKEVVRSQTAFGATIGGAASSRKTRITFPPVEEVDSGELGDGQSSEAENRTFYGVNVQPGPDLDDLRTTAIADDLFVQMAEADDIGHLLNDSCEHLNRLCGKLEAVQDRYSSPAPLRFDNRAGDVSIASRAPQGAAKKEREHIERQALAYVTQTCHWKELNRLDDTIDQGGFKSLRQSFPKLTHRHKYLTSLTDWTLRDEDRFRRAMWGKELPIVDKSDHDVTQNPGQGSRHGASFMSLADVGESTFLKGRKEKINSSMRSSSSAGAL